MNSPDDRVLHLISVNHTKVSAEARLALDLSTMDWFNLEAYARFSLGVIGWIQISTCNRIEILIDGPANLDIDLIIKKWINLSKSEIPLEQFTVLSQNPVVIKYLLELSTGLRSAIYGDDQILAQVKQAFELSRLTSSGLSTLIERAYQCIMRCHKEITGKTEFKNQGVSLAYYGLKYAKNYFKEGDTIVNKSILIIGAGNMAEQVVKYISKFPFKKVYITNRTLSKAQHLVVGKDVTIIDKEHLDDINPDVIASCTVHGLSLVQDHYKPKLIIDYSLNAHALSTFSAPILDLETMQQAIDSKNEKRNAYIEDVNSIIENHCTLYQAWAEQWLIRRSK